MYCEILGKAYTCIRYTIMRIYYYLVDCIYGMKNDKRTNNKIEMLCLN